MADSSSAALHTKLNMSTRLEIVQESGIKKYMNNGGNFITGVDISSEVNNSSLSLILKCMLLTCQCILNIYRNQLKNETNDFKGSATPLCRVPLRYRFHWISYKKERKDSEDQRLYSRERLSKHSISKQMI